MTKSLPPNPSVKFLKLEAKSLLKTHRRADPSCCDVLRNLHQFKDKPAPEILKSEIGLQQVQFALAMEYGFKNWEELMGVVFSHEKRESNSDIDYSKIELRANCFVYDSYCLAISEAAKLLGANISYEDILALTTNAFAPGFDICNDCKDLWGCEAWLSRVGSVDIAWDRLGLSVMSIFDDSENDQIDLPEYINRLRDVMDSGKVIVSHCDWSNPDRFVEPWWAGIVIDIKDDGTLIGAHPNGRTDNEIEKPNPGTMLAISLAEPTLDEMSTIHPLLQENIRRIRGEGEEGKAFSKTELMAFGCDAMDEWIKQMQDVPYFCPPCQEHGENGWQSATKIARYTIHRSEIAASFLRRISESLPENIQDDIFNISKCYDNIAILLKNSVDNYKEIIGDIDKQKEHAETVLHPVKNELIKAADEMEKALTLMGS